MRSPLCALVLGLCVAMSSAASAAPFRCTNQKHLINIETNETGRTMEGPVCAQVMVNALRYNAYLGKKYQAPTAGANLTTILPSPFAPTGEEEKPKIEGAEKKKSLEQAFDEISQFVDSNVTKWYQQETNNRKKMVEISKNLTQLQNAIVQSDTTFNTSGAAGVIALLATEPFKTNLSAATISSFQNGWKNSDELVTKLEIMQQNLNLLPVVHPDDTGKIDGNPCQADKNLLGWTNWDKCYDSQFKALQTEITTLLNDANLWTSDSTKAQQFDSNLNLLNFWSQRAATLIPGSFILQSDVPCPVLFNQSQAIEIDLYTTDETGMFPGQTLQQQPASTPVLTVNCSSAFAVSAGAGFSTIKSPTYAIVQSAPPSGSTTPGSQVGVSSNSAISPYPIALAHARLNDWSDNRYAVDASFGIGVNPNAGGSAAPDFLTGLTLSFLRTMFVTAGLDVGKQTTLAGGYHLHDTVPTGVNALPTTSSYTGGFGFAISFTKP